MTKNNDYELRRPTVNEISQTFREYVEYMQDQERHTDAACKEVDDFDEYCSARFQKDINLQEALYEKMMNCAVEFEESGFIAGFKTALYVLFGKSEASSQPEQITTPDSGKSQLVATAASQDTSNQTLHTVSSDWKDPEHDC